MKKIFSLALLVVLLLTACTNAPAPVQTAAAVVAESVKYEPGTLPICGDTGSMAIYCAPDGAQFTWDSVAAQYEPYIMTPIASVVATEVANGPTWTPEPIQTFTAMPTMAPMTESYVIPTIPTETPFPTPDANPFYLDEVEDPEVKITVLDDPEPGDNYYYVLVTDKDGRAETVRVDETFNVEALTPEDGLAVLTGAKLITPGVFEFFQREEWIVTPKGIEYLPHYANLDEIRANVQDVCSNHQCLVAYYKLDEVTEQGRIELRQVNLEFATGAAMGLNAAMDEVANQVAAAGVHLRENHFEVIAFGSCASGYCAPGSDVDIAVYIDVPDGQDSAFVPLQVFQALAGNMNAILTESHLAGSGISEINILIVARNGTGFEPMFLKIPVPPPAQ